MDIEAVRNMVEQASLASFAIGLAIGFFFFTLRAKSLH